MPIFSFCNVSQVSVWWYSQLLLSPALFWRNSAKAVEGSVSSQSFLHLCISSMHFIETYCIIVQCFWDSTNSSTSCIVNIIPFRCHLRTFELNVTPNLLMPKQRFQILQLVTTLLQSPLDDVWRWSIVFGNIFQQLVFSFSITSSIHSSLLFSSNISKCHYALSKFRSVRSKSNYRLYQIPIGRT